MSWQSLRLAEWNAGFRKAVRSKLGGDIFALYSAQGLNYLLPLLVLPYLLRVLGPARYGSIAFAQAVMGYAVILTEFGFNLSATRAVARAREDADEISRIFWSTLAAKGVLLVIAAAAIVLAVLLVPALQEHWNVIGVCGLVVIGSVVLPQWYFQGLERMRVMALTQVVSRIIMLLLTFVLVRSADDELRAAAILSMPPLLAGILGLVAVGFIAPVRFHRPRLIDVRGALASSWHLFVSGAATSLYLNSNAFIIGLVCGDYAVALYSLANRVVLAVFNLLGPVILAVFPRASLLFGRSLLEGRDFVRRLSVPLLGAAGLLSALLLLFAGPIVRLLGGTQYLDSAPVLRMMAPLPLILAAGTVLAQIVMVNLGLERSLSRIYLGLGLLSLVLLPVLANRYGALGGAQSLLVVEVLGPVFMFRAIGRHGFWSRVERP